MHALILAAGKGSRLKPFTDNTPKALVPVAGRPLFIWVAEKLMATGVRKIVVNVHHYAEQLKQFISKLDYPGIEFMISDESSALLDTGGAIVHARSLLHTESPFFVYNADVISDIDLAAMYNAHKNSGALATLAVSTRSSSRYFLWQHGRLCGWKNEQTGETILSDNANTSEYQVMAFSGIHLIDPAIFKHTRRSGRFSVRDLYLDLADKMRISPFEHNDLYWADTGTPEKLARAGKMIQDNRLKFM